MTYPYKRLKLKDGSTRDEHRLFVEANLGRRLSRNEVVHHKNENKRDNRLENLEVMTLSEHAKTHRCGVALSDVTKAKISAAHKGMPKNRHLSDEQVRRVRALHGSGMGPTAISLLVGIHKCTVIDINKGRRYAYVV